MRVKFCGITNLDDAREAARLGAWAIGLNHWVDGPRYCEPDTAVEISAALKRRLEVVGVFVNPTLDEVVAAAENESLTMLQLHGGEGAAFCREAARRTGCKVIKAIRVRSRADVRAAEAFRTDFHLLDTHRPGTHGGTGESFDWEFLADRHSEVPLILAGGLTPDNVDEAIAATHPFAVDVASGVEAEPGIKDHARMAAFAERAQAVAA
jgi:phosphoribosylanthranilate isomerase